MADALKVDVERRFAGGAAIAAAFDVPMRGGTILVLFGPSGAGKTTVVRLIAGLDRPDRGAITFGGETWCDVDRGAFISPQVRRVGCAFQAPALFPHLTVRANVAYGLGAVDRADRAARVDRVLHLTELDEFAERYPQQLSGGQAQRVSLARALAPSPRLLLLDEPFAGLDTPTRTRFRRLLRAVVGELGVPCVMVTHDRTEAIALGDQMAVLADGRIRQVGPVVDVIRRPADLVVARSVGVDSVLPARVSGALDGLVDLEVGDIRLRAVDTEIGNGTGAGAEVFACIRAEDVTLELAAASSASARNHLPGRIVSVESEGPVDRVTLDCGFPLAALITRHAREEMGLSPGVAVVAAIKATAIHLVPRV